MEVLPTDLQVENGNRKVQLRLEVIQGKVYHLLKLAHGCQHRKNRFDDHAFIMVEGLAHLDTFVGSHEVSPFAYRLATFSLEDLMTFCN